MKLEDAAALAEKVRVAILPLCERVEVAGSIRRKRPEVNDIDIVAIPRAKKGPRVSAFGPLAIYEPADVWKQLIPQTVEKLDAVCLQRGPELMRFVFPGIDFQVDVYRARPETWGVILLVRTGSKEHNVKLCSLARSRGLKLSAAHGVVSQESEFEEVIASRTEEEIFAALGIPFVKPEDREVRA
jgi:DNA polymerase (family 10)